MSAFNPFKPFGGFSVLLLLAGAWPALAQTNTLPKTFQGFPVGASVRVHADKPLLLLYHATLKEITSSNIVVVAGMDRFVIARNAVTLGDSAKPATPAAAAAVRVVVAPAAQNPGTAPGQHPAATGPLAEVQRQLLGQAAAPGQTNVADQYQATMQAYQEGKLSLGDITASAEKVLTEMEQYQTERQNDPQYESQIAILRDFVQRAKAGETVDAAPQK